MNRKPTAVIGWLLHFRYGMPKRQSHVRDCDNGFEGSRFMCTRLGLILFKEPVSMKKQRSQRTFLPLFKWPKAPRTWWTRCQCGREAMATDLLRASVYCPYNGRWYGMVAEVLPGLTVSKSTLGLQLFIFSP